MTENISAIAKFNFWNGNVIDLGYERKKYIEKIHRFSGNKLIKVLVGQRRTGKSYLLRQILRQFIQSGVPQQNTFYINKEFVELDFLTDYKAELKPLGKVYLFIDEIQTIEGWNGWLIHIRKTLSILMKSLSVVPICKCCQAN